MLDTGADPGAGLIDGSQGTLTVRQTWETVSITNLSNKDIEINGIEPFDTSGGGSVLIENGTNNYTFNITHDYGPTAVSIVNAGTGAIILNGLIDNPIGTTTITNLRGDIRATATGKVRSNRTVLSAAGNIGTAPPAGGQPAFLDLELVGSDDPTTGLLVPDLEAQAGGGLYLDVTGLDRQPVSTTPFALSFGTLTAGGDLDLQIEATVVQNQLGSNAPSGFEVSVNGQLYANHYQPDGSGVAFAAPMAVFGTGTAVENTQVNVGLLQAAGNITVDGNFGSTRIGLTASTQLTGSGQGHINVYTDGNVILNHVGGDLRVGTIVSTLGDVTLTSQSNIVDAIGGTQAKVTGNNITLTASGGSIGSDLNDLEIDSAYSAAGQVTAQAASDVYLEETSGNLTVNQISATGGQVRLTTLFGATTDNDIVVSSGHTVSAGGSITLQAANSLVVAGSVLAGGTLTFAVDQEINGVKPTRGGTVSLTTATLAGKQIMLLGGDNNDVMSAAGQSIGVIAYAYGGNDQITGGSGNDQIYGGSGTDILIDGNGNDLIVAGTGVGDVIIVGSGKDTIYASPNGTAGTGQSDWNPNVQYSATNLPTGHHGTYISVGSGNDLIYGQGGDDEIVGGGGNDVIYAGSGNNLIIGGAGADTIYGGGGNDVIYAFQPGSWTGVDSGVVRTVYGGTGNETIYGGSGDDQIYGGLGNTNISAGNGNVTIYAAAGNNTIGDGNGNDVIYGSPTGNDTITTGSGTDRILAGNGNDTITLGAGNDTVTLGTGVDTVYGGAGSDIIVGGGGTDTLYGHAATVPADSNVDYIYGDVGAQGSVIAAATDVVQVGYASNDSLAVPPTPVPTPVNYSLQYSSATLPNGMVETGRWGDLAGSASGPGLSGDATSLATAPSVAVGLNGSQYVAWVDTRNGSPQIFVAELVNGAWTQLGGSASGNSAAAGVSAGHTPTADPSITVDASGAPIVAWTAEHANGTTDVYAARYNSTTQTWQALGGSLSGSGISGTGRAGQAHVVATSAGPMVVWLDSSAGGESVYARIFSGGTWQAIGGSASGTGLGGGTVADDVRGLTATTDGNNVAVAWSEWDSSTGIRQVYLEQYSGGAWSALSGSASGAGVSGVLGTALPAVVTNNATPSLAYFQGSLFVAWQTQSDQGIALAVAQYQGSAAPTLVNTITTPSIFADPTLSSGGGALRLAWINTPLGGQTTSIYVMRYNGSQFVEELPGEAQGGGVSLTGGDTTALAMTTDASGRSTLVWEDASSGHDQIYARGMSATVSQVFVANASTSIQSILNSRSFSAGDVILVEGVHNENITLSAADSGVLDLWRARVQCSTARSRWRLARPGSWYNASMWTGTVTVNGANGFVLDRVDRRAPSRSTAAAARRLRTIS